jgi:hypothetical protein
MEGAVRMVGPPPLALCPFRGIRLFSASHRIFHREGARDAKELRNHVTGGSRDSGEGQWVLLRAEAGSASERGDTGGGGEGAALRSWRLCEIHVFYAGQKGHCLSPRRKGRQELRMDGSGASGIGTRSVAGIHVGPGSGSPWCRRRTSPLTPRPPLPRGERG